jgi:hypothetical protein
MLDVVDGGVPYVFGDDGFGHFQKYHGTDCLDEEVVR